MRIYAHDGVIQDNGSVQVNNTCEAEGRPVNILGSASPADAGYGASGVFRVQFPGQPPPSCPGPNYIVQGTFEECSPCLSYGWSFCTDRLNRLHGRDCHCPSKQLLHPLHPEPRAASRGSCSGCKCHSPLYIDDEYTREDTC